MEKVKVNKDVFEALQRVECKFSFDALMRLQSSGGFTSEIYLPLNNLSVRELAELLINGYELEETPEEKLLASYQVTSVNDFDRGIDEGMVYTLNTLGIKIKGIND